MQWPIDKLTMNCNCSCNGIIFFCVRTFLTDVFDTGGTHFSRSWNFFSWVSSVSWDGRLTHNGSLWLIEDNKKKHQWSVNWRFEICPVCMYLYSKLNVSHCIRHTLVYILKKLINFIFVSIIQLVCPLTDNLYCHRMQSVTISLVQVA